MERFLLFIKHHFNFLWQIIERVNGLLFSLAFKSQLDGLLPIIVQDNLMAPYTFRTLRRNDLRSLVDLIERQNGSDLEYFKPHGFDLIAIEKQLRIKSFLMMGAFDNDLLIGYFFLRFFINGKCFVGRLIDKKYRGLGIGEVMNRILYQTAWQMSFRCLSTISRNNAKVMGSHARNPYIHVLKELDNDYLLVEFSMDNH